MPRATLHEPLQFCHKPRKLDNVMTASPEKKNPIEQLAIQRKTERIWQGEEAVPASYPYILPDYRQPFPHIGTEQQLFLDNYMVEWLYDLDRVLERPRKHDGPVMLLNDFDWEGAGFTLPRAIYDEEERLFKMWYCITTHPYVKTDHLVLCYAESEDGLSWHKPLDRGGVPYRQHTHTNIVLDGADWHTVLREPHEPDPDKRYKIVFWDTNSPLKFGIAYSADGIQATRTQVTPYRLTHNVCTFWDPAIQKYVSYGQHGHHWNYLYRVRGVGRQESEDLLRWSPRTAVLLPDGNEPPSTEYGTMAVHKVGSLYIGTVARYDMDPAWHSSGPKGQKNNFRDYVHPHQRLVYSRDGFQWSFAANRAAWLENGPPGSFDYGYVDHLSAPVCYDGQLYFYYWAVRTKQDVFMWPNAQDIIIPPEKRRAEYPQTDYWLSLSTAERRRLHSVGLATLRQDGYMRVQPQHGQGTLLTRQFVFEGDRLYLNLNADFGWAQVEVLDDEMVPIAGFTRSDCDLIRGDSVAHEVRWHGIADVRVLWNRPIRLQIYITDAWLYGFRFGYVSSG